jgi:7-carboxy-7-deazaguanine synthase (Cx14CxxC type)
LEKDRSAAICQFCDTDFVGTDGPGGGKFANENELAEHVAGFWPQVEKSEAGQKWVVCTGGEPALQLDEALIRAFHENDFKVAIETNGTIALPNGIDWICVSPKADTKLIQTQGHELKLVYPQQENKPKQFENLDFEVFSLQPLDDKNKAAHSEAAFKYCLEHPKWRLSVQSHKYIGVP